MVQAGDFEFDSAPRLLQDVFDLKKIKSFCT